MWQRWIYFQCVLGRRNSIEATKKKTILFSLPYYLRVLFLDFRRYLLDFYYIDCIKWQIINSEMEHLQEDLNCLNSLTIQLLCILNLKECNAEELYRAEWWTSIYVGGIQWSSSLFSRRFFILSFHMHLPRYFVIRFCVRNINIFRRIFHTQYWMKGGLRKRIDLGLIKYEYT